MEILLPAPLLSRGAAVTLLLYPEPSRDLINREDTSARLTGGCFQAWLCLVEGFDPFRKRTLSYCTAVSVPFTVLGATPGEEGSGLQHVGQGLGGGSCERQLEMPEGLNLLEAQLREELSWEGDEGV